MLSVTQRIYGEQIFRSFRASLFRLFLVIFTPDIIETSLKKRFCNVYDDNFQILNKCRNMQNARKTSRALNVYKYRYLLTLLFTLEHVVHFHKYAVVAIFPFTLLRFLR